MDNADIQFYDSIEDEYRSGTHNLGKDFFAPCMARCTQYSRAVGYFSSTALTNWCALLHRVLQQEIVPLRLIVSPQLSPTDAIAIREVVSEEGRKRALNEVIEHLIDDILFSKSDNLTEVNRVKIFSWLIASNTLELRFAFAKHIDFPGIFHDKLGIFEFSDGRVIAFAGSANESISGHEKNYESIDVYRSWIDEDKKRVKNKVFAFEQIWSNEAKGISVEPLSDKSIKKIKERAPSVSPLPIDDFELEHERFRDLPKPKDDNEENLWLHQDEAVQRFLEQRAGILEMATGSGKTRTALKIISELLNQGRINCVIISTTGTDLLDQWCIELLDWLSFENHQFAVLKHYEKHKQLGLFALNPSGKILVISLNQLGGLFQQLSPEKCHNSIIVHDEVHGLGIPTAQKMLKGHHQYFSYRLGLSATPEREYDDIGNEFVEREIGKTIFSFPLEAAISRGILCEFEYAPLNYDLTDEDKNRIQQVYKKQAARKYQGIPMTQEEVWIDIARVYKTAELKPVVFEQYLRSNPAVLKSSILFVETMEYGETILRILHQHTHLYRTYYSDDDRNNLIKFSKGKIDCLITCHKISQGIDIQSLNNVILFSSARAKLETIQRIGRCLRVDKSNPNKRALIVDFIRTENAGHFPNSDQERSEWLTNLSRVKKGGSIEY